MTLLGHWPTLYSPALISTLSSVFYYTTSDTTNVTNLFPYVEEPGKSYVIKYYPKNLSLIRAVKRRSCSA